MTSTSQDWADVLAGVVERAHLTPGDRLSSVLDDAVAPLGLTPWAGTPTSWVSSWSAPMDRALA